ncbi:MAG: sigma-70 family RNA polymerase sigma factor [Elusimicrobiota bacterium]
MMDRTVDNNEDIGFIKDILQGDTGSFALLVRKYKNMIFNLAYRMTGNLAEAEDIIQESFVRAFKGLKQFNLVQGFPNWLYTITINVCRTHNRRNKFKWISLSGPAVKKDEHQEWFPEIGDEKDNPEDALDREENEKKVQKIIKMLPFKYRAIFVLRYIENKSYQEIASCAELPLGTVKTYLYRGQKILYEKLKNG